MVLVLVAFKNDLTSIHSIFLFVGFFRAVASLHSHSASNATSGS